MKLAHITLEVSHVRQIGSPDGVTAGAALLGPNAVVLLGIWCSNSLSYSIVYATSEADQLLGQHHRRQAQCACKTSPASAN